MAVREPGAARQDAAAAVDIVIVNWNAGALLRQCVRSIAATLGDDPRLGRVVVVDNASTDGSWRLDDEGLPLVLIRNERNLGFAAACNQGARDSAAEALLFLNPDTRLLPSAVQGALDHLAAPPNARTGIVGIQLVDAAGTVHRSCARFPTPGRMIGAAFGLDRLAPRLCPPHFMTEWNHLTTRPVDQVMGAFFMIRRRLFEALGGFDERFFVYFEEVDLALRAARAGWRTDYLADVRAYHLGGGTTRTILARRLGYQLTSRLHFAFKHFSRPAALGVAAASLIVEPAVRLTAAGLRRAPAEARAALGGARLAWTGLPAVLRTAR